MADGRIYMLQPSFASGEISPDVASRVDLDKYQSALLQAENVFIRPYGSAYRRPGLEYRAQVSDMNDSDGARLHEFAVDANTSFLLLFKYHKVEIYKEKYNSLTQTETLTLITTKTTPYTDADLPKLRFAQSADVMFIASGKYPVKVLKRTAAETFSSLSNFVAAPGYFDETTMVSGVTILPDSTHGSGVTLTATGGDAFTNGQIGNDIMLRQRVAAKTVSRSGTGSGKSSAVTAGTAGWKVISHGTWKGSFKIEYCDTNSNDDADWLTLREYSSDDDFNVTESGTFDEQWWIRINADITSGTFSADLTRLPYVNEGWAVITGVTNATTATVTVKKKFSSTTVPSDDWAFGSWSDDYGYPSCVVFFQDRLCFAANARQPYMVWMSRTGDYYNFGTERVDGTVTDDSAVAISFISRKDYRILHMMAEADFLVMTEGNEWVISGSQVVTPTDVTPKVQTSRGTTDVEPIMIGGQMIYIQRHGKTVRDMQYNFGTDSYDGMDLNILAKHITENRVIVDATYRQEPDYMAFFVMNDGTCACLTYVNEQRVYAWSRLKTHGRIIAVGKCACNFKVFTGGFKMDEAIDNIYFVVQHGGTLKCTIERLSNNLHVDDPNWYSVLDCSVYGTNSPAAATASAPKLKNMTVDVLADGRCIKGLKANGSGVVTLPAKCSKFVIGIPYQSTWEMPNIEFPINDGTLQGRRKKVAEVILRLDNSLGGRVGVDINKTDIIKYDELLATENIKLFSGEKIVTVPNTSGGFNERGRVVIVSDDAYPMSISSIVRAVVPGG